MARSIGSHVSLLLPELISLLRDDFPDVLGGLIHNLDDTVDIFSRVMNPEKLTGTNDLLAAILSCEKVRSR